MNHKIKKSLKIGGITIGALLTLIILCLCISSFILFSPKKLTPIVNDLLSNYLKADVKINQVELTYFSSFPYLELDLNQVLLLSKDKQDTLTYIPKGTATLKVLDLISNYLIVKELDIEGGVTNIKIDKQGHLNWDIFPTSDEPSTPLDSLFEKIDIKGIHIQSGTIFYQNEQFNHQSSIANADIKLEGSFISQKLLTTLNVKFQDINYQDSAMNVDLSSIQFDLDNSSNLPQIQLHAAMQFKHPKFSYLKDELINKNAQLALKINGGYQFVENKIQIDEMMLTLNDIQFKLNGNIHLGDSSYYTDLKFALDTIGLHSIYKTLPPQYHYKKYGTLQEGIIYCNGTVKGDFNKYSIPKIKAILNIQDLKAIAYESQIDKFNIQAEADIDLARMSQSSVKIKQCNYQGDLGKLSLTANLKNLTSNIHINTSVQTQMDLNALKKMFAKSIDYQTEGKIKANLKGDFALKDMLALKVEKMKLNGEINIDSVLIANSQDSLNINIDLARLTFGSQVTDTTLSQGQAAFKCKVRLDSMYLNYKNHYIADVRRLSGGYKCETEIGKLVSSQTGRVSCRGLIFHIPKENMRLSTTKISLNLKILPNEEKKTSPKVVIAIKTDSVYCRQKRSGLRLNNTNLSIVLKPIQQLYKDSLQGEGDKRQYLSLKEMTSNEMITQFVKYTELPDTVDIGKRFLDEFTYEGSLAFDNLRMKNQNFIFPIELKSTKLALTTRKIMLNNAEIKVGNTDMVITGFIQNFKRALFQNGVLKGNITLVSKKLDCNQLIPAINKLASLSETDNSNSDNLGQNNKETHTDSIVSDTMMLLMIPKNINMTMKMDVDSLVLGKTKLTKLYGDVEIRDEYAYLNKFELSNQIGRMNLELAYKALSPKSADLWIKFRLDKVEIRDLINLYPEIDTLLPVTKSLEGLINFDLTASTKLDSAMNILLSKTKATCNMKGKNLVLLDGETFTEIAKTLMFKNKKRNLIDSVSVNLVLRKDIIQIFPFVLSMDRYRLAVGGQQKLDLNFDYHITVLESPVPFKLGIDITGNTDNFKYKIVKPKYKKADSVVISKDVEDKVISVQNMFKRILQQEFDNIIGEKKDSNNINDDVSFSEY